MSLELALYHTQEYRAEELEGPVYAEGFHQWLGNGFYFWHDAEFAHWWGRGQKCKGVEKTYSVYEMKIQIEQDDLLDTVFNKDEYDFFKEKIIRFARLYHEYFNEKPTLTQFNKFIHDFGVWKDIRVIRFQDMTNDSELLEVKGFFYKKRIQYRFNDIDFNFTFRLVENRKCQR